MLVLVGWLPAYAPRLPAYALQSPAQLRPPVRAQLRPPVRAQLFVYARPLAPMQLRPLAPMQLRPALPAPCLSGCGVLPFALLSLPPRFALLPYPNAQSKISLLLRILPACELPQRACALPQPTRPPMQPQPTRPPPPQSMHCSCFQSRLRPVLCLLQDKAGDHVLSEHSSLLMALVGAGRCATVPRQGATAAHCRWRGRQACPYNLHSGSCQRGAALHPFVKHGQGGILSVRPSAWRCLIDAIVQRGPPRPFDNFARSR